MDLHYVSLAKFPRIPFPTQDWVTSAPKTHLHDIWHVKEKEQSPFLAEKTRASLKALRQLVDIVFLFASLPDTGQQ